MEKVEYVHHVVDAAHIRNLGEDSVSDKIQAVLELVKNSYDADATTCTVTFRGKATDKKTTIAEILIEDNGVGMTKDDIKSKYLKVGTANKIRETLSPKFGRRVSGEKGMGHYSAQRLGDEITIITTPENYKKREFTQEDKHTFVLQMNWKKYEEGKSFESIQNPLTIKEQNKKYGTTVIIRELRDTWNLEKTKDNPETDLEMLSKALGSLVLPGELQEGKKEKGFKPVVHLEGTQADDTLEIESILLKSAPYKMESHLRDKKLHYKVFKRRDKLDDFMLIAEDAFPSNAVCGNADFTVYWFPGSASEWADKAIGRRNLQDQLHENHGVKIFNDKIRIMPYGEKDDDWLELDERKSGPAMGGKVRNVHLVGFVRLTRQNNPSIIETTTRQALRKNLAFKSLKKDFVLASIEEMEAARKEDKKKSEKKINPANKIAVEVSHIKDQISRLKAPSREKNNLARSLSPILKYSKMQKEQSDEIEENLTSNIEMYRNLSSVGIQTIAFNHEIIDPIRWVNGTLKNIIRDNKSLEKEYMEKIQQCVHNVEISLDWANHIREFSTLLAGTDVTKKKKHTLNMEKVLNQILVDFKPIFQAVGINAKKPIFVGKVPTLFMNRASFESVIINLISNSIRALRRVRGRDKAIKIEVSKDGSNIIMQFEDNGIGIKHEFRRKIFQPLFTTYNSPEDRGTGMGLTIIKEIVEDENGGDFSLQKTIYENDEPGKGMTMFTIKLPIQKVTKK